MTAKRKSLSSALSEKHTETPTAPASTGSSASRSPQQKDQLLGIMVRPEAKIALKELQISLSKDRGYTVSTKDLVSEALNDIMKKYHRAEIFPSRGGEYE